MTVKELIELNWLIGDIENNVRKDGNGVLLKKLKIGAGVEETNCLELREKEIVKNTEINIRDEGDFHYGLILNKIPKNWLNLKVYSWRMRRLYRPDDRESSLESIEMNCYPDGYKEEKEKQNTEKDNGQLSLFEEN